MGKYRYRVHHNWPYITYEVHVRKFGLWNYVCHIPVHIFRVWDSHPHHPHYLGQSFNHFKAIPVGFFVNISAWWFHVTATLWLPGSKLLFLLDFFGGHVVLLMAGTIRWFQPFGMVSTRWKSHENRNDAGICPLRVGTKNMNMPSFAYRVCVAPNHAELSKKIEEWNLSSCWNGCSFQG